MHPASWAVLPAPHLGGETPSPAWALFLLMGTISADEAPVKGWGGAGLYSPSSKSKEGHLLCFTEPQDL